MNENRNKEILGRIESGETEMSIAKEMKISRQRINQIKNEFGPKYGFKPYTKECQFCGNTYQPVSYGVKSQRCTRLKCKLDYHRMKSKEWNKKHPDYHHRYRLRNKV